ncbi:hypothetical protein LTR56_000850 [Elasticomyces elasticus]|nr:hypothetical protein LTR22_018623 [Elasticomyces elasticus]KAK3660474.1 hypothetical protein LTR56_000850 [Elasticomyces elasticus]KAK4912276.1 hypothetical protein LTR49_019277 [Elasticomyces elasticus]KAK5751790.1 hypothetical protein LTS12_018118 [Elasticomyces elasticus]
MATRRSNRVNGTKLTEKIEDMEARIQAEVLNEKRRAQQVKYASTTCKFTIFDLVPELRERIYYYAMETEQPQPLMGLKAPALALVSKQVRAEVLPVFFGKCRFMVEITSNYPWMRQMKATRVSHVKPIEHKKYKYRLNGWNGIKYGCHPAYHASGRVSGASSAKSWLTRLEKREGINVAFRNLEVLVVGMELGRIGKLEETWMTIVVPTTRKLRPVVTYDGYAGAPYTPRNRWPRRVAGTHHPQELTLVRERAKAKMEEIAEGRDGFKGLTLDDLGVTAEKFQYWPDPRRGIAQ